MQESSTFPCANAKMFQHWKVKNEMLWRGRPADPNCQTTPLQNPLNLQDPLIRRKGETFPEEVYNDIFLVISETHPE